MLILKGGNYLRLQIERKVFDSLPINAIGHACFEPMVPVYQGGMSQRNGQEVHEYRAEFYRSLSQGQQALLGLFTYYDHAVRSTDEFQRISKSYISQHIFGIVKKGAEYFHDTEMGQLLSRIEQTILANENSEIASVNLDELYAQLKEVAPYTMVKIGVCIKEKPAEFMCLT